MIPQLGPHDTNKLQSLGQLYAWSYSSYNDGIAKAKYSPRKTRVKRRDASYFSEPKTRQNVIFLSSQANDVLYIHNMQYIMKHLKLFIIILVIYIFHSIKIYMLREQALVNFNSFLSNQNIILHIMYVQYK